MQTVVTPWLKTAHVSLKVLRLDDFCPQASGNKLFKLKYNLIAALDRGHRKIISFGGAYSNHIHALALAGKQHGIRTVGVIRGEPVDPLNPTLNDARQAGMTLHFVSRECYRQRHEGEFQQQLQQRLGASYIMPEGGSNELAIKGCEEIVDHISAHLGTDYDVVAVPCGTGGTLAGVARAVADDKLALGVSVLKGVDYLNDEIAGYIGITDRHNWRLEGDYHCGGYAKCHRDLAMFIQEFIGQTGIPVEPVYSGKLFFALKAMIESGQFAKGTRIVAVHTGGMQGLRGMQPRLDRLLNR